MKKLCQILEWDEAAKARYSASIDEWDIVFFLESFWDINLLRKNKQKHVDEWRATGSSPAQSIS